MGSLIPGVIVGHATDYQGMTGCTVFLCPEGSVGSVDVRGPAPASRELILLAPDKSVTTINAILLSGGSAFGLSAADGVVRYLDERGIGHPTPVRLVPIVAAAGVYDLFLGNPAATPGTEMGYEACTVATDGPIKQGNVGAGTGVTVGKWGGFTSMMKSGFGLARIDEQNLIVAAAAVVNAMGDVIGEDGSVLAGALANDGSWLSHADRWRRFPEIPPEPGTNTTLIVVATNARLTKLDAYRLAQRAHDGLAIAVRPAHTTHDGDTAFALSTGQIEASFDLVANIAVEMVSEAIREAVRNSWSLAGIPGLATSTN